MSKRPAALTVVMALTGLFVIGFFVQLFLASLGMMGAESYKAHEDFGFTVMHALSLLIFIATVVSPTRKRDAPFGFAFFLLVTGVIVLAGQHEHHPWVAAFHPISAFAVTGMAFWLHMRARQGGGGEVRAAAATAG
jgi:hypothetical protein